MRLGGFESSGTQRFRGRTTSTSQRLSKQTLLCFVSAPSRSFIPNRSLLDGADTPKQRTKALMRALLKINDLEKVRGRPSPGTWHHLETSDTVLLSTCVCVCSQFQTCEVHHCKNAFACSFTHRSGWKLAFSGDTMPCDAFVCIGQCR